MNHKVIPIDEEARMQIFYLHLYNLSQACEDEKLKFPSSFEEWKNKYLDKNRM